MSNTFKFSLIIVLLCASTTLNAQLWDQQAKLVHATDGSGDTADLGGGSIDIDGYTVITGAEQDESSGAPNSGAAFIYYKNQGGIDNYGLVVELTGSDTDAGDQFGAAVAVDGNYAVVGARTAEFSSGFPTETGTAFIFKKDEGGADNWGEVDRLAGAFTAGSNFGNAVAIEGDIVAIGALGTSVGGQVNVYENDGADNFLAVGAAIPNPTSVAGSRFGTSVALLGDLLFVGADSANSANGFSGEVYVFDRNNGGANNWGLIQTITPPVNGQIRFGDNIDANGPYLIISADRETHSGVTWAGAAYLYDNSSGSYSVNTKFTRSSPQLRDFFGADVGINDGRAIIGMPSTNGEANEDGGAFIYFEDQLGIGVWGEEEALSPWSNPPINTNIDFEADSQYGSAVAIDLAWAGVGAKKKSETVVDHGATYIYTNPLLLSTEFVHFLAQKEGKRAKLTYTLSEVSIGDQLTIEHSLDGVHWASIKSFTAPSTRTLASFEDYHSNPTIGLNYYRIGVLNLAGEMNQSQVRLVEITQSIELKLYPNPAYDFLTIQLSSNDTLNQVYTINIMDLNGQLQFRQEYIPNSSLINVPVDRLAAGMYVVSVNSNGRNLTTEKIIVQH